MSAVDVPKVPESRSRRRMIAPILLAVGTAAMVVAVSACGGPADNRLSTKDSGQSVEQPAEGPAVSAEAPRGTDEDIWKVTLDEVSQASVRWGGPEHGTAEYVIAERNSAIKVLRNNDLSGGETPDKDEVFVFLLRGSFVGKYARVPPGSEQPTGNALVFTVSRGPSIFSDTDAPLVMDLGLLKSAPDLSAVNASVTEVQF